MKKLINNILSNPPEAFKKIRNAGFILTSVGLTIGAVVASFATAGIALPGTILVVSNVITGLGGSLIVIGQVPKKIEDAKTDQP